MVLARGSRYVDRAPGVHVRGWIRISRTRTQRGHWKRHQTRPRRSSRREAPGSKPASRATCRVASDTAGTWSTFGRMPGHMQPRTPPQCERARCSSCGRHHPGLDRPLDDVPKGGAVGREADAVQVFVEGADDRDPQQRVDRHVAHDDGLDTIVKRVTAAGIERL